MMNKRKYWYSARYKRKLLKQQLDFVFDKLQHEQIFSLDDSNENEEDLTSLSNTLDNNENLQLTNKEATDKTTKRNEVERNNVVQHNNECGNFNNDEDMPDQSILDDIFHDECPNDISSETESENQNGLNVDRLQKNLAYWASSERITRTSVNKLLQLLREERDLQPLPVNVRTLLKTPRSIDKPMTMEHGQYCHFGIEAGLIFIFQTCNSALIPDEVILSINIDGLPLVKSSNSQLWPILGSIRNFYNKKPFLIGAFHGYKKPPAPDIFLKKFVEEAQNLKENGFYYNKKIIPFKIACYICDAPARAYICCIKNHTGYYGCSKCETRGEYRGTVVFPELNARLRTAESFKNQTQKVHHTGISPLLALNDDLISDVPLDYMHIVLLGVTRKMLQKMTGKLNPMKLSTQQINEISLRLINLRKHVPCEFARKSRSLGELDRMKATEFRQFLLYTGIIALRKIVRDDVYKHFLHLSVAIRLLATSNLKYEENRYAKQLLEKYIIDFQRLYGIEVTSYNVHGLQHLADDVLKWGAVDDYSAFIFENYLQEIKKMLRKCDKPLEQLQNRIYESRNTDFKEVVNTHDDNYELRKEYNGGPLLNQCTAPMYKEMRYRGFRFTTSKPNNCCHLQHVLELENTLEILLD
ncbi:PREDICTED: uncharacterized protein LOC105449098 [Wasmannia auropunctata]|uniref:uncharacterized protein LOC105449098 n=1 Tax=Wasmannia auropunctata TaxID=64793 RepID=UPI0005EF1162|nr:PREDICTED: uncharacterized protein LOC105449098 [Wasmannia auropunctata]